MTIELRPEVRAFAEAMELKLRKHDDWPGWKDCDPYVLLNDALAHFGKFSTHFHDRDEERLLADAADVANFLMMICDVRDILPSFTAERGVTTDA